MLPEKGEKNYASKELTKWLRDRFETEMDGNGWLAVSSNGIPLCRIKYNGQFLSNVDKTSRMNTAVKLQIFRMRFLRCENMSDSTNTHRR